MNSFWKDNGFAKVAATWKRIISSSRFSENKLRAVMSIKTLTMTVMALIAGWWCLTDAACASVSWDIKLFRLHRLPSADSSQDWSLPSSSSAHRPQIQHLRSTNIIKRFNVGEVAPTSSECIVASACIARPERLNGCKPNFSRSHN